MAPDPATVPLLVVLDQPRVEYRGHSHALPPTLPGWLLVLLGLRGDWVAREELVGLLWPQESQAPGQHRLRVHLHRLKQLLTGWGIAHALEAERQRLRVVLASDLAAFRSALGRGERALALGLYRRALLDGWRLRDFPVLEEWVELERQQVAITWRAAALRHATDLVAHDAPHEALVLLHRLRQDEPLAEDVMQPVLRCCARTGEAALGLRLYEAFAQRLELELGVKPMGATRQLADALRDVALPLSMPLPTPLPPPQAAPPAVPGALRKQSPFVGRTRLIDRLRCEDTRSVHQLVGPPGIGKSRLVEQALPGALWLRCREALAELPFHPMLDVLREARVRIAPDLGLHAVELARLIPEYAPTAQVPADPQWVKPRLFEALVVAFQAADAPIVLDDVQWADALTCEWLAYAAPRRSLRMVLTRREGSGGQALLRTLGDLELEGTLTTYSLEPLDAHEMRALVAGLADAGEGPPQFSAWLARHSAGNPFYALELLRHLFDAGQLRIESGRWATEIDLVTRDYSELVVPPRVLAVTQARTLRLREPARRVLEAASILDGESHPAAEALGALAGLTPDGVAEAWEELDAAGFLHAGGVAHDLVRQSVEQGLTALRRQRLHRRAAEYFDLLHLNRPGGAANVARHWRLAGEPQRALPAEMQVAQTLRERGALEAAAQAFGDIARRAEQPALRLRAEAAAAEHLLLSDLRAQREMLERIAGEIASLPDDTGAPALHIRVHTALADNAVYAGDLARAAQHVAAFAPALAAAPHDERLHALEMVIEVSMRLGEFDAAHTALAQARALWPGKVTFDIHEAMLAWSQVRLPDAVRIFERVAREHPSHCRYIMVENDLGVALLAQGDLAGAEKWIRRGLVTWDGIAHAQCLSQLNLGAVLTSAGRWPQAQEALDSALTLARAQHSALFEGEALHRIGRLRLLCGRAGAAAEALDAALACLGDADDPLRVAQWHAQAASAAVANGDHAKAELHLRRADACIGTRVHALAQARLARAQAWQALSLQSAADARRAADAMHTLARDHGMDELTAEALLLRVRAHLMAGDGEPALAERWLQEADTIARYRGLADLAWRSQALLARLAAPRHAEAAAQRARALRDALFTPAAALGADAVAAERHEPRVTAAE